MTPDEVIDLLSIITGYDRRTVGQVDVESWRLALDDPRTPNLVYDECVDAVILHYRDTSDFIMPAHILTRVKAQRQAALARIMPPKQTDRSAYAKAGELWRRQYTETAQRMKLQKADVLSHPDLAARLTEPPLGYAKPEQWNGGIPPETCGGAHNDSARRDALLALVNEALNRKDDHA